MAVAANAVGIRFLGAIGDNTSEVGRFAAFWNVLELDKENGVGATTGGNAGGWTALC